MPRPASSPRTAAIAASILLANELDVAFQDGKGTKDTSRQIIFISICLTTAFWLALLLSRLKEVWDALPDYRAGEATNAVNDVSDQKATSEAMLVVADQAHKEGVVINNNPFDAAITENALGVRFDLSGIRMPIGASIARPQRKVGAVYMPLLPSH